MPNWTPEQQRAIDADGSLLVSAGAGSGKTAVLTARIVRLIRGGESINSILCATFTNAAAAEMKKRIEKALSKAAGEAEGAEAEKLYRAARGVSAASISTLHSFCTQVLRRHFNLVGLDPAFRVADDGETAILRQTAYDELVEERYAEGTPEFEILMQGLGGDEKAQDAVYSVYDFAMSQADPNAWLDEALKQYDISNEEELLSSSAAEALKKRSVIAIAANCDALEQACGALRNIGGNIPAEYIETNELLLARTLLDNDSAGEFARAIAPFAFGKGKIKWDGIEGAERDRADAARKKLKGEIKAQKEFWADTEGMLATIRLHRPIMRELCGFIKELEKRYAEKKSDAGCIDYSDMEHKCLEVLNIPEARDEYRRRFKHVFMDEYQDCNPVQESILQSVAEGGCTFLVGDVKQSIYRFRLAEPGIFMQRYADYAGGNGGELIRLNSNFRSSEGVINSVNSLFESIMHKETADLEYDEDAKLKFARGNGAGDDIRAEFTLLDMMEREDDDLTEDEYEIETDAASAEAAFAAGRIHELMDTERITDASSGEERPLRYSDFAVLLRSYKRSAETWMRTLAANGVPAYAQLSGGYFDAMEVRVFMDLLRIIDNRRQDIPLCAVLMSPMGGFNEADLVSLKTDFTAPKDYSGEWAWIDRVKAASIAGGELGQKAERFIKNLERFRREAKLMSAESLIGALLDQTGYGEYCAAMPGGRQRQANLEALCERARGCAQAGVTSLSGFLNYMEKVSKADVYGAPQTGGANVVSIMSVHASKGLEFPYVIIGSLNSKFVREGKEDLVCERELGIGARLIVGDTKQKSFVHEAIRASAEAKARAEEMRVLYVAMTRARERLIMLCAAKDGYKLAKDSLAPATQCGIITQDSFSKWILGHILRTENGERIREKYGLGAKASGNAYINARVLPAPQAMPGGDRMSEDEYGEFVKKALERAPKEQDEILFGRPYEHPTDIELPTKLSVTMLSGGSRTELDEAPEFMNEGHAAATGIGTAVHDIMRRVELDKPINRQSVAELRNSLVNAGLMDAAAGRAVPVYAIAGFFECELGQRLIKSQNVRRETPFNLRISARELLGADTDETILLQGVIDCCFEENGEWVLIDYKTDRVEDGVSARDTAAKHFTQLRLYKTALERLTGKKVAQSYIYMFRANEAVEYTGDEQNGK